LFLLERHPRSSWPGERSPSVAFWLEVHAHLRRDCAGLDAAGNDHARSRAPAAQLVVIAEARLRGLVSRMHGHHQIEDFEYFPAFRRDEPRLATGFDRLEAEHADLGRDVASAEAALADLRAVVTRSTDTRDAANVALARFTDAAQQLCARLRSHLDAEEDLVIPLLIERQAR
jgi:hypothetical protein